MSKNLRPDENSVDALRPGMSLNFPIIAAAPGEDDRTTGSDAEWITIDSGAQWLIMGNKDLLSNLKPLSSPQYFRIGNGELMQATHSGRLGQWDGILYSEECKFNLMPVHWQNKYE